MMKNLLFLIILLGVSTSLSAEWLYNFQYKKCVPSPTYYQGIEASIKEVSKYPQCRKTTILEELHPETSYQSQKFAMVSGTHYPMWMWLTSSLYICETKGKPLYFYFFNRKDGCNAMSHAVQKR